MSIILVSIIGYFFGCIQSSYLLVKFFKKQDIREQGVNNAGASNTLIVHGKAMALTVLLIDVLKAVVSIHLVKLFISQGILEGSAWLLVLNGFFVILGHNYPFFMKFKGGKGTASFIGMSLGLGLFIGLWSVVVLIGGAIAFRYLVLGVFLSIIALGVSIYFSAYAAVPSYVIMGLLFSQSLFLHRTNIKRIIEGTEKEFLKTLFNKKS